ncbi:MAG: PaaI family thioesterase [Opitutaceae bacterium]|jgi:acyl-coenzyme A thioesterase PaaI-like protein
MTTSTPIPGTATVRTELRAASSATLSEMSAREHSACFACGSSSSTGLRLAFRLSAVGDAVVADWQPPAWAIGYDGTVHGGLIATVLDSAMVHALFARSCSARTADLHLRYRHPVRPIAPCHIQACLVSQRGGALQLKATLHQADRLCARAEAMFMRPPTVNLPDFIDP